MFNLWADMPNKYLHVIKSQKTSYTQVIGNLIFFVSNIKGVINHQVQSFLAAKKC